MGLMAAAFILFFLAAVWARSSEGAPISVFTLSWAGTLALFSLDGAFGVIGYDPLTLGTLTTTALALAMVLCGWFFAPKAAVEAAAAERVDSLRLPWVLFALCTVGYLLYMNQVVHLCSGKTVAGFFLKWNFEETTGDLKEFGGISGRLAVLPAIAIPLNIYLMGRRQQRDRMLALLTFIEFLYLVSPRRALILQTIVSSVFVHVFVKGLTPRMVRSMVGGAAAMVLLFALTQVGLNKASGGVGVGLNSAYVYLTSNLPIFQELTKNSQDTNGEYVLNIPLRVTNKLGFNKAPDLSIPFVKVPVEGNTAPFFYYPYRDWGVAGVVVLSWIIGFATATVYNRKERGAAWVLVSAFCTTAMVFSVRENIFITYQFWYCAAVAALLGTVLRQRPVVTAPRIEA
ncbi:oligosaccharide repeat unit polymerase [Geomonas oryzisoli]|uniref:Oligosaccharide repeat unit polymerase n=1 Tax=Geomonas oryzisoli TaxID=2847992 RepID=A0ABX8JCJ3_9BACT|nr:O-antigen polymerase [Geomonas oryzisoli]QWV94801.1 oligosaccharide repeat unit polymerase [Geomonas oryzisoli]